jgi:hypothetical protein
MIYYECYLYRSDGSICGASPILREKDVEAIDVARQIFTGRDDAICVELWQESRQVYAQKARAQAS